MTGADAKRAAGGRYLHGALDNASLNGLRRDVANGRMGQKQRMTTSFIHEIQAQRVVFAAGAVARVADEAARLGVNRALVIATPGSGARLGARLVEILGARAAGLHAQAVVHVPKAVAEAGLAAAASADGLVAAGGGAAIGLAKIIARDRGLPILA